MIKSIASGSHYITVQGGSVPPYLSPGSLCAGQLRYNPNSSNIEVYDGVTWHSLSGHNQIDLSDRAKEVLQWAEKKMQEELSLQQLLSRHPGLKELKDKFEMMRVLCQDEENKK